MILELGLILLQTHCLERSHKEGRDERLKVSPADDVLPDVRLSLCAIESGKEAHPAGKLLILGTSRANEIRELAQRQARIGIAL